MADAGWQTIIAGSPPPGTEDSGGWQTIAKTSPPKAEETPFQQPGVLQQAGGFAQGLLEFGAAIPGAILGTGLAAGHALTGEDPKIALEGMHGVMEETNLAKKIMPDAVLEQLQKTYGYRVGNFPAELIGKVFEGLGKLGGWASALTGAEKDTSEKVDAYTQLVAMALGLASPGKGKFKGTQKEYFDLHDKILKGNPQWDSISKQEREVNDVLNKTMGKIDSEWQTIVQGKETERRATDMGAQARDTGQFQEAAPNPYNLPEALRRQIEEEHNPTNAPETRVEGQGELFTGREALTPDELASRRFVTEDGTSLRNQTDDIVTSGHRGYEDAGLGGAAEMANVPTVDRMANQERRLPEETLPFDRQTATQQVQEAVRQAADRKATPRPDPNIIGDRADLFYQAAQDALSRGDREKAFE